MNTLPPTLLISIIVFAFLGCKTTSSTPSANFKAQAIPTDSLGIKSYKLIIPEAPPNHDTSKDGAENQWEEYLINGLIDSFHP